MKIEISAVESRFMSFRSHFSKNNEDYVSATEWVNGEGYDITISTSDGTKHISLARHEWQALSCLMASFSVSDIDE